MKDRYDSQGHDKPSALAEDQIAKMLSSYESTIRRQAAEKNELEKIIDLLESNARIQAKLLADTGRERDDLRSQLVKANSALEQIAGDDEPRIALHGTTAQALRDIARHAIAGKVDKS